MWGKGVIQDGVQDGRRTLIPNITHQRHQIHHSRTHPDGVILGAAAILSCCVILGYTAFHEKN